MSKETGASSLKQIFLSLLMDYVGNSEGVDRNEFIKIVKDTTGLSESTIQQYLKEQSGQFLPNSKGRIIIVDGASFMSTTSRAPNKNETSVGSGIHRRTGRWRRRS